jgi:HK97 family phage major capsid protein
MWARFYGPSRQNGAWFHNQDVETQFPVMVKTDGTAYGFPVLLPPGGLSGSQYSTLYGRPMVPIEYAPTLGTVGDLMLADFSQYALIEKGGIGVASSVHVRFLYDEMVLKFTWRLNGMVINWPTALTPFKGTSTLSPFVVLATRS